MLHNDPKVRFKPVVVVSLIGLSLRIGVTLNSLEPMALIPTCHTPPERSVRGATKSVGSFLANDLRKSKYYNHENLQ
jgi:hypothetical protein